jgi:HSP20 family protein
MSTLVRRERPALPDLLLSIWPFSEMSLEFPVRDSMAMRVEELVDGESMVLRAEIPGVDPEKDVDISVADGVLTVKAERREETHEGEEGKPGYRSEFHYGSYSRSMTLPKNVGADDITATYKDGILELRMPLGTEPKAPNKVPIIRA